MRSILIILVSSLLSACGSFWELVMTDEEKRLLRQSAKEAAACQVSRTIQAPMGHKNLYQYEYGSCIAAPLRDEYWFGREQKAPSKRLYHDFFCRQPINYQLTRYHSFCQDYVFSERLGSDHSLSENEAWTLNPASRFRLPLVWQYELDQPFMTSRIYKLTDVVEQRVFAPVSDPLLLRKGSGHCQLQMRIYKQDPLAEGGKSLLMFHGGGGHQRGFHSLAMESRIPEFTSQGYTVYMPFYRLIGGGESGVECSHASWKQIREDASDALFWVRKHRHEFADRTDKVLLMAQGSGAMLAGWLMTRHAEYIDRSLLLYPLLDTSKMKQELLAEGGFKKGRATLERLLKQPLEQVADDDPVLLETSFITHMASAPGEFPPVLLLHGERDKRIPKSQSVEACKAFSNGRKPVKAYNSGAIQCGQSTMVLLEGAEYQLDYCLSGVECPAGDEASRKQVLQALELANNWLKGE